MTRPSFDAALAGFRRFAKSRNAPTSLAFIEADDIVVTGDYATIRRPPPHVRLRQAEEVFDAAMDSGLGVMITGLAASRTELFCSVYRPANREDAISRLIPDDVKYVLRSPLFVAHVAGPLLWWLLRRRERTDAWAREWKKDTFGDPG